METVGQATLVLLMIALLMLWQTWPSADPVIPPKTEFRSNPNIEPAEDKSESKADLTVALQLCVTPGTPNDAMAPGTTSWAAWR